MPTGPAAERRRRRGRGPDRAIAPWASATTASVLVALLAACSPSAPDATTPPAAATRSETGASAAETPTPTPAPVLVPDGTAEANLPYFTAIVETVADGSDAARGEAYVDALAGAGFDRAAMQLTSDTTTIGQPAESIQFSVAWTDACLVGQVGPATGAPVTAVLPLLGGGRCLLGDTVDLG